MTPRRHGCAAGPDERPVRAYPRGSAHEGEETQLSEQKPAAAEAGTDDAVLLFVGGPLDGRVEIRAARHGDPLPTVTHVHLHGGPKVVHRYDLEPLSDGVGVYNLRPQARRPARDESAAD
ncbi:hypothetical protein [Blastococcus sp. SYSU DS0539]